MPKDLEMRLKIVGDVFFLIFGTGVSQPNMASKLWWAILKKKSFGGLME